MLFVLKYRLSQAGKLKLRSHYDSISDLIADMWKEHLPRKSAAAFHSKLQLIRQNELSIIISLRWPRTTAMSEIMRF